MNSEGDTIMHDQPTTAKPSSDNGTVSMSTTGASDVSSASAASTPHSKSAKRKLDKQARRAAWKEEKKRRVAEQAAEREKLMQPHMLAAMASGETTAAAEMDTVTVKPAAQPRTGQLSLENVLETEYFFQDGLRVPYPYWFEFSTHAKRRWVGRPVLEVLQGEYGSGAVEETETEDYYRSTIHSGSFRINGQKVDPDYRVHDGDHFQFYLHRHETPARTDEEQPSMDATSASTSASASSSSSPSHSTSSNQLSYGIRVHTETPHLLVVDKPSSLPAHPCGKFRHNSVLFLLAKQRVQAALKRLGLEGQGRATIESHPHAASAIDAALDLYVVHRLDAVTSGLLILAKTRQAARTIATNMERKHVRKEYVARVQGRMDESVQELRVETPIYQHRINGHMIMDTKPLPPELAAAALAAAQRAPHEQEPDEFKRSVTIISFLAYDPKSDTSLVKCCPLTGRTHQIRLQLRHIGFPIANDIRYGGRCGTSSLNNDRTKIRPPNIETLTSNAVATPSDVNNAATLSHSSSSSSSSSASSSLPPSTSSSSAAATPPPPASDSTLPLSGPSFSPSAYWSNPGGRRALLACESEMQRLRRIEEEAIDRSGSCPICNKLSNQQNNDEHKSDASNSTNAAAASVFPSPSPSPSSSSSSTPTSTAVDMESFDTPTHSTTFSSRIRVEYIWLHAYKYAYDPTFGEDEETGEGRKPAAAAPEERNGKAQNKVPCVQAPASDTLSSPPPPTMPSTTASSSSSSEPVGWSFEIPWPTWALEIAPPHLQHQFQQNQQQSMERVPRPAADSQSSSQP